MGQIIGKMLSSRSPGSCHSCKHLLKHISRGFPPEQFPSYHARFKGCDLCTFFLSAGKGNDSLKWVLGDTPLMSGTFKLRVALTPSPNQGIHCASLDATKGDMVFKGEKIMILDVQGNSPHTLAAGNGSMAVVRRWLTECTTSHQYCSNSITDGLGDPLLPTRVIDVGPGDGSEEPRLIVSNSNRGKYAALSHCWGSRQQFTTDSNTLRQRMQCIPTSSLPKTFRDAVTITRELQIRYLWIDSLCILQDEDKTDWKREATKMASVYGNSYITIAAAAAADSHWGCFSSHSLFNRDPSSPVPRLEVPPGTALSYANGLFAMRVATSYNDVASIYSNSPLSQRAWVLQEMILSPRVVFFADDQIYWMCLERVVSEDGFYDEPNSIIRRPTAVTTGMRGIEEGHAAIRRFRSIATTYIQQWWELVEQYSCRDLKFEGDKFVALAGLTSAFQQKMPGNTPAAGLWSLDLHEGLLWLPRYNYSNSRPIDGIPSWSWASFKGPVVFPTLYCITSRTPNYSGAEFSRPNIIWSGSPFTSHITQARIQATGLLRTATFAISPAGPNAAGRKYPWITNALIYDLLDSEGKVIGGAVFDHRQPGKEGSLKVFEISRATASDTHGFKFNNFHNVLLIERREKNPYHYCRIGVGLISLDSGFFRAAERQGIQLT